MVARDASNNRVDVGTWSAGEDTRVHGSRNSHVSHSPAQVANGSHTFTVNWRAPSEGVGDITFYVAANAANGNNSRGAGDNVYLTQLNVSQPAPPNQPPTLSLAQETVNAIQGMSVPIEGIVLEDPDAGSGNVSLNLSVQNGSLTAADSVVDGLGANGIEENGTSAVTLIGTVAQINATLSAPNGVLYQSSPEFVGSETVQLTANDNANTGTGGALTDDAVIQISVVIDPSIGEPGTPSGEGPRLTDLFRSQSGFQFTLIGISGREYLVEHTEDFLTWNLLQRVTLDSDTAAMMDEASANSPFRYYRASEAPEPEP